VSDLVLQVENLGKCYQIAHQSNAPNFLLRDAIATSVKSLLNRKSQQQSSFWALDRVSFSLQQGDRLGIIGRNGAGKSTLLKLLSRITEPTRGRIEILGRVASLLEVGTGFHPELTGRENVYLNGAILGMSRSEIAQKFDEIVSFAEVERFLDTPVKRYSSGMYVRLAFAVAAHLEPEVLIVDEVLAVGDTQFQQKCLNKMEDVGRQGRTVLFVSHNMQTISSLCNRGIVLEGGKVTFHGEVQQAIDVYLENSYQLMSQIPLLERRDRTGSGRVKISSFRVLDAQGREAEILKSGLDYDFEFGYVNESGQILENVIVSFAIVDDRGQTILLLRTNFTDSNVVLSREGVVRCRLNTLPLANGTYRLPIFFSYRESEVLDYIQDAVTIVVEGGDFFGTGQVGLPKKCKILTKAEWRSF
jgi:lipopolysaccharide transport system ATP-binding protein